MGHYFESSCELALSSGERERGGRKRDRATILYFIFSRKKEARERGCRALLASGLRAEVIPDSALFPIYVCPRASAAAPGELVVSLRFISATFRAVPCPGIAPATCVLKLLRRKPSPPRRISFPSVLVSLRSRGKTTLIMTVKFRDGRRKSVSARGALRSASKS